MRRFFLAPFGALLLAGCAAEPAPMLRQVVEIRSDGTRNALPEERMSAFVRLIRARLPAPARGNDARTTSLLALEKDLPAGTGTEGFYIAVVRSAKGAGELRYFEQTGHLPRVDRFYHRAMTAEELAAFDVLMKQMSLADLPKEASQVMAAETQAATLPGSTIADDQGAVPEASYRLTAADVKSAQTIEVHAAATAAGPGVIGFLERLTRQEGLTCTYTQPIPATAQVLFAEPHRQAVAIWTRGNDLRARIAGEKMDEEPAWMAFAEGKWEPSDAPELSAATMPEVPPATTVTASQPEAAAPPVQVGVEPRATAALVPQNLHAAGNESPIPAAVSPALSASQPATQPEVTATQPAPFSNPGMLPLEESWWTEPGENFTTVWHYLPLTQTNSQRLGFVVPALVFDDAHAAINLQQKKLYILHDGHLIALPIPAAAFGKK